MTLILIGSVSAADIDGNDTEIISASDNDEIVNIENNLKTLSSNNHTFKELSEEIENGGNYTELKYDYYYYDNQKFDPITINTENKVIDGRGAIIDMKGANLITLKLDASGVIIKNLTIKNAKYANEDWDSFKCNGAAILMNSGTVENCNFINNIVNNYGGAISGSGTVKNCNFIDNQGNHAGAVDLTSGTIENCNFTNNTAKFIGGAVHLENGSITNCNFINNGVGDYAGAVYIESGIVKNCNFTDNHADSKGGAVYFSNAGTVTNCNFTNNKGFSTNMKGAAVFFNKGGTVTKCNFTNNKGTNTDGIGGALYFNINGNVTNSNFANNSAGYGGAINFVNTGTVTNCNFVNNIATGNNNYGGGAINIGNSGTVTNCNFTNNKARWGAGVHFNSNGNVINCNFVNNTATISGGGVHANSGTIRNSNFINNQATGANSNGGAINIYSGSITYCNFNGNKASFGSAIHYFGKIYGSAISNSVFLNNKANAETLNIVQKDNKIEITFTGEDNFLNAIWCNVKEDANFNNVTYWGANGITNSNDSPTISASTYEAGQNITIMWNVDGIAFNMTKVTDINGKIVLDMIAGNSTITARHNEDSYYTKKETTKTFSKTGNNASLDISALEWTATATVNPNNATGNVIFTVENETGIVRTVETTLNNGAADIDLSKLIAGEYNITAAYTGDTNYYSTKTTIAYTLLHGKNTYSELSSEIGSGGDIKLKYGYYAFDYGPTIKITTPNSIIDGNGAVIDMAGSNINALRITASDVTIKNLTIKNANINNDGGAIYFFNKGNVINSNFINNSARYGGAVYFSDNTVGKVENCNFINNTAYFNGGAICFENTGNVSNCNFTNNQASISDGGALYFDENGEVTKCNFNNNKAPRDDGGAICFWNKGKLTDSSFTDNNADYGGAVSISLGSIDNCTFTGNNATVASAVYYYSDSKTKTISNSIFLNNRANADNLQIVENGNNIEITLKGQNNLINAIYSKKDSLVQFTNVTYWGADGIKNTGTTPISLSRSNNEAGQKITIIGIVNDSIINTTKVTDIDGKIVLGGVADSYLIIACHDEDSYYTHAETTKTNMQFYVNLTSMTSHNRTVNITAKSNIKNEIIQGKLLFILQNGDEINANYTSDGTWWAEYTFDKYGEHNVTASYIGLESVAINNSTITLTKTDSTLTLDNVTLDYGESINVTITTEGATGITAKIDENKVGVSDYTIPISGLNVGNYTLTVTTIADEDHNPVTKNATITVNKIDSELTVDDIIFDYNGSGSTNVSFTGATGIEAYINNQPKAIVNVKDNTITVSALDAGTYTLTVTTKPDDNHNPVTKNATVTVNKIDSTLTFDKTELNYGEDITIITEGAVGITAEIDGQPIAVDNFTVSVSELIAGKYILTVTTVPDDNHNPITKTTAITINKINTTISVDVIAGAMKNEVNIIVNVNETATGLIEFIIKDRIVYLNVNEGKAVYDTILPGGDYNVAVTYLGDAIFNPNSTSKAFTVVDPVKLNTTVKCNIAIDENTVTVTANVNTKATGFVEFIIAGKKYYAPIDEGKAVLSNDFIAGTYSGSVNYLGDENFNPATTLVYFTVIEQNVTLDNTPIEVAVVTTNNDAIIIAHINETATGLIEFIIEDRVIYIPATNGEAYTDITLPEGNYTVTVTYMGDSKFNPNSTSETFTVHDFVKLNTTIKCDILIDENTVTVTANVDSNATGFVEFIIAGKKYYAPIDEGKAILTNDFIAGTYSGNANYLGDENFNPTSTLVYFTVIEQNTTLDNTPIEVAVVTINNDAIIIAHINETATGLIEFIIEDRAVYVPATNGEAYTDITLPEGEYNVTVTYMGDSKFNPNSTSKTFTVHNLVKLNTTIKCDILIDENTVTITANVDTEATGFVEFIIAGKKYYAPIDEGKAILTNDFIAGTYSGNANYLGDEVYNPTSTLIYFTVIEQNTTLDNTPIDVAIVAINNDVSITAKVNTSATGLIEFIIEDKVAYIPITNGETVYEVILPEGNYNVTVTYLGDSKFNPNSTSKTFTVHDPVKLNTTIECNVIVDENIVSITSNVDESATGFVEIELNGTSIFAKVENGKAFIDTSLANGNYTIRVTYLGDEKYNSNTTTVSFTVDGTPLIIPKASEFSDVTIDDNLTIYIILKDETGKVIANAPITYTVNGTAGTTTTGNDGSFTIKAVNGAKVDIKYAGNENILPTNLTLKFNVPDVPVVVKTDTHFDIANRAITINGYAIDGPANEQGIYYATTLLDANGKPVSNVYIEFAVNNKIYNRTTYENGSFKPYKLNMIRAGRYTIAFNFAGDDNYTHAFATVCAELAKKPIKITASKKTYKVATKTKKYTVTLSTVKGVDGKMYLSPKKVTLKVNGKTYTAKTNSKGKVTFKITNLKKKAKYKAVISYAGDKTYEAATKSVTLTVK